MQVLPALSRTQGQRLLRELKANNKIHFTDQTKAARWYPGPSVGDSKA